MISSWILLRDRGLSSALSATSGSKKAMDAITWRADVDIIFAINAVGNMELANAEEEVSLEELLPKTQTLLQDLNNQIYLDNKTMVIPSVQTHFFHSPNLNSIHLVASSTSITTISTPFSLDHLKQEIMAWTHQPEEVVHLGDQIGGEVIEHTNL